MRGGESSGAVEGGNILPYAQPERRFGRHGNTAVLIVTALIPVSYVAFSVLRRHQLSLPDPYNNPYTTWSSAFLVAVPGLAIADLVLVMVLHRCLATGVKVVAWMVIVSTLLYLGTCVVQMLRFVFLGM